MNRNLTVSKSIEINGTAKQVWDALTNPEKIKAYLFGTQTTTDWKVGSPISFQGDYQGQTYNDKGNVLVNIPFKHLEYDYWSGFSGLEDKPENYFTVIYKIEERPDSVNFTWRQEGFSSEKGYEHTEKSLYGMLEQIKNLVENN